jgi:hypothetical protein
LRYHDRRIEVDLSHERSVLTLSEGGPVTVNFRGQDVELVPDEPTVFDSAADAHADDALTGELSLDDIEAERSMLVMREGDATDETAMTSQE